MGGGWLFMALFWGLVLAGIIALVVLIARRSESHRTDSESAMDVLKKRYAKGEINREEFERMKDDIA